MVRSCHPLAGLTGRDPGSPRQTTKSIIRVEADARLLDDVGLVQAGS